MEPETIQTFNIPFTRHPSTSEAIVPNSAGGQAPGNLLTPCYLIYFIFRKIRIPINTPANIEIRRKMIRNV